MQILAEFSEAEFLPDGSVRIPNRKARFIERLWSLGFKLLRVYSTDCRTGIRVGRLLIVDPNK